MKILLAFLLCVLALPAHAWQGTVSRVVDGDTIHVLSSGGTGMRVRLYGIDCPESRQAGGKGATAYVKSAVTRKVEIEEVAKDRYGRSVAVVLLDDGRSLNEMIVESGWAWVYLKYCKKTMCSDWRDLEAVARDKRLGLWRDDNPVPPWVWRKHKK